VEAGSVLTTGHPVDPTGSYSPTGRIKIVTGNNQPVKFPPNLTCSSKGLRDEKSIAGFLAAPVYQIIYIYFVS
jgi:hypothetical protein